MRSVRVTLGLVVMILCVLAAAGRAWAGGPPGAVPRPPSLHVPFSGLVFERNQGQTARDVQYLARYGRDVVYLTRSHLVVSMAEADGRRAALRMSLAGSRPPRSIQGLEPFDGRVHYMVGSSASAWRRDVPTYGKVRYAQVYRGIDVIYYGTRDREFEYDFMVAPGADPNVIQLRFEGADRVTLGPNGDLQVALNGRTLRHRKPVAYQVVNGDRRDVSVAYRIDRRGAVRFALGRYDRARPLVIDPVFLFSTYLGGAWDTSRVIAADPLGNTYVAGLAAGLDFPTTTGAFQESAQGAQEDPETCPACDGFVTKFSRTGAFVYSTYLGGSGVDRVGAIAVDALGHAYVAGSTESADFPTTPGAFWRSCPPYTLGRCVQYWGFVAKLNATGSSLDFSTRTGPQMDPASIAVDTHANVVIGGFVSTALPPWFGDPLPVGLPTTPGAFQPEHRGNGDGFVAKLKADGSSYLFATYFGGANQDIVVDIALDSQGAIYLTGNTQSTPDSFPLSVTAFQQDCPRGEGEFVNTCFIAFVAKLNENGTALGYSTYLGGFGPPINAITGFTSEASAIAVDGGGHAYVTGWALSTDFPTTPGTIKPTTMTQDAFVTKLSPSGSALVYSTNLGGDQSEGPADPIGHDQGTDIQVDSAGNAYIVGNTVATDFPLAGTPLPFSEPGPFLAKLNSSGSALVESTYLGMAGYSNLSLALGPAGTVHVTGITSPLSWLPTGDPGLPLVNAAQTTPARSFVAKIGEVLPFATVTANGSEQPTTLTAGAPLDVHVAFDGNPLGSIAAGEVYIGIATPTGTYWLDLPTLTFKPTLTVAYTGAIPSFGPSRLFHLDDAGTLPAGTYVPFMIVDTDTNGVPNGTYFHYSVIEIGTPVVP